MQMGGSGKEVPMIGTIIFIGAGWNILSRVAYHTNVRDECMSTTE